MKWWIMSSLVGIFIGTWGCEGPAGPSGPQGPIGEQGPTGPEGPAGTAGNNNALTTPCLSPCHTFTGIVDQWRNSTHYAVYVRNLAGEEVSTWTGTTPCGNCHAIDAHEQRVKGNVLSPGGTVANVKDGLLEYLDVSKTPNKLADALYAGQAKVASVYCTTCHKITTENDPHRTGKVYTKGTFGFWVPVSAEDEAIIEKSPSGGSVTGMGAGKYTTGNVCIWCHKSRKDVTNYITPTNNQLTSHYWGPHDGPQADVYDGKGGYHFTGQTYANSTHATFPEGCIRCHMPQATNNKDAANNTYPDHSFYAQLSACQVCHTSAKNFNVNEVQTIVTAGLQELRGLLNQAGYLTRGNVTNPNDPDTPLSESDLEDTNFRLDLTRVNSPPSSLDANTAGALYNYLIIARGSGLGIHNTKYVEQLLWDSIAFLKGNPPSFIKARP